LKADCKRDLSDALVWIFQEHARFFDSSVRDVIDKVYSRHLFEFFAQVIGADIHKARDFREAKLFVRILMNEFSRFPDFNRLGPISISEARLRDLRFGRHEYHWNATQTIWLSLGWQLFVRF
jgi:hypothetical protein